MGLLGRLLGKRPSASGAALPPKVAAIFGRIAAFLSDEELQNQSLRPELQQLLRNGGAFDSLPNGQGEFGRMPTNPIPVNGPIGELVYLSTLAWSGGQPVLGHRLASLEALGVDVYETVTLDGAQWDVLYFDMYHIRKSRLAPKGYDIVKHSDRSYFLLATNRRVSRFPESMAQALGETTNALLGVPLVRPDLQSALSVGQFSRPPVHARRVAQFV